MFICSACKAEIADECYCFEKYVFCEACAREGLSYADAAPKCVMCDEYIIKGEYTAFDTEGGTLIFCPECLNRLKTNDCFMLFQEPE